MPGRPVRRWGGTPSRGSPQPAERSSAEPLMEAGEPSGPDQNPPSVLWIIEHVWKHEMMDVLQGVSAACWPDLDLRRLSLEESWKLRVGSAYVFSVVRNRDVALFERALDFLEATYRLRPGLVAAIKHMKILFGLKTLVVMTMLRDDRGSVDVVSKINRFFPNKLPQYLDHCTHREMFLMRKSHTDFKGFAQTLALDKNRRRRYIQSEMEEQYGERYAQKVEDRLLQYLRELEGALSGDTHLDEILKKQSPPSHQEKLLLDILTSDPPAAAAALNKLLHCDVSSCPPGQLSQKRTRTSGPSRTSVEVQSMVFRGDRDATPERRSVLGGIRPSDEDGAPVSTVTRTVQTVHQFCSKHRRWVRTILQECPDDGADVSSSPPLFPSSSSTSSSQDLTPSNLVPGPSHRPSSCSAVCPAAGRACESSVVQRVNVASSSTSEPGPPGPDLTWRSPPPPSGSPLTPIDRTSRNEDCPQCETSSSRKTCQDDPGDGLKSGPSGPGPEPPSTGDGPSPSLLDEVVSSSGSTQTSLDRDACPHHPVTSGSSSRPSRQTSESEDPGSGRSDVKRLPDSRESSISEERSARREDLQEAGDLQTSPPDSSRDLDSVSPRCPVSVSTTQTPDQEEMSSDSESPRCWSSHHHLPLAPPLVNVSSSSPSTVSPTSPEDRTAMDSSPPSNHSSGVSVLAPPPRAERRLLRPRRPPPHFSAVKQSGASRRKPSDENPEFRGRAPSLRRAAASDSSHQDGATSWSRDQTVRLSRPGDRPLPPSLTPVVRLVDLYSDLRGTSPRVSVRRSNSRRPPGPGPRLRWTSGERDASSGRLKTGSDVKTPPDRQDLLVVPHRTSRLSLDMRQSPLNTDELRLHRPALTVTFNVSGFHASEPSGPPAPTRSLRRTAPPPAPPVRLSLQSQASLLRSGVLQPLVRLTRLEDDRRAAEGDGDDVESSFDPNELYSGSEWSDGEPDPDYKPSFKKKRLLQEYEDAKMAASDL